MDNTETLNKAQKEAVLHEEGPVLLIAGAGSGKTKTLTHRVAKLIKDGHSPQSILLLTFTRKSSQEMLQRASDLLDKRCQSVAGGTFHAFAAKVLRQCGTPIGIEENFTVLDRHDAEELIAQVRKKNTKSKTEKRFPKKNTLLSIFSKKTNCNQEIKEILTEDYPQFSEFEEDIIHIEKEYTLEKKNKQLLDYDDLLLELLRLLKEDPKTKTFLQNYFSHILVDEYQDTNHIQAEILSNLCNTKNNIMVVGDDAQSIYAFRGALHQNILDFPKKFPNTTLIKLEQNYRSTQEILDLSNAIINNSTNKIKKSMFSLEKKGEKPHYREYRDEYEQSKAIAKEILTLREEGLPLKEIAVLMRSGSHSNELELELNKCNIPFQKIGGLKFTESAHIKDITAYLKVIDNPKDSLSWQRILYHIDGIGEKGSLDITEEIVSQFNEKQELSFKKFYKKPYADALKKLEETLKNIKAPQTIEEIVTKIITYYEPLFQTLYDNPQKRKQDFDSIVTLSKKYHSLTLFLTELALDPIEESELKKKTKKEDEYITLSTIHSAKGLEWDTVFLISAIEGYLPSFQSLNNKESLEEERRLLYVALTRAKKRLYISKPNFTLSHSYGPGKGGLGLSELCRFLQEDNIIKEYTQSKTQTLHENTDEVFTDIDGTDTSEEDVFSKRKYYF